VVRVRSTKVLRGHGGGITTPVANMNYNTKTETAVVVSSLPRLLKLTWWQQNLRLRKLKHEYVGTLQSRTI